MNKSLYSWLIWFLGLAAAAGMLQTILRLLAGLQLFYFDSFIGWFLVANGTLFIAMLLLLRYYYGQQYRFVFLAGSLYFVCGLLYAIVFYTILRFHRLANYNEPLSFLALGSGMVYSVSLLFLRAGHVRCLKAAGALMLIIGLIVLIDRTTQWAPFASCVVPILFMLHFLRERGRIEAGGAGGAAWKPWEFWMGLAGILCSVLLVVFGWMLSTECSTSLYWGNQVYQETKALAQLSEPGVFVNGKGEALHYRLIKPLDCDPARSYPLVISLPYGGQPATDTIKQIEGAVMAELLVADGNRKDYPAFIFIPNLAPGAGWGGIPGYPNTDSLVFAAIVALDRRFPIDAKRRYVAGLSRGGFGTWNFISKRPDLFAAAIPVAGGGDPKLAPNAVNVAVWAFHGAMDTHAPVSGSRDMINAIKSAGGNPKYTEYPEEGHNIWDKVKATPGLLDWLFAKHK